MSVNAFEEQAAQLAHQYVVLAGAFIESRPPGSFISKEQLNTALGGQRVDLRELQDYLDEIESTHGFWSCMKTGRFVGLFILSRAAYTAYCNYQV